MKQSFRHAVCAAAIVALTSYHLYAGIIVEKTGGGGGAGSPTAAAGDAQQIQFNDGADAFTADAGLTYNTTSDKLSVTSGVSINTGVGGAQLASLSTLVSGTPGAKIYGTLPNTAGNGYTGLQVEFTPDNGTEVRELRIINIGGSRAGNQGAGTAVGLNVDIRSGFTSAVDSDGGYSPNGGNVAIYGSTQDDGDYSDEQVGVWGEAPSNAKSWGVIGGGIGGNSTFTNRTGVTGYAMQGTQAGSAVGGYFYISESTAVNGPGDTTLLSAPQSAGILVSNKGVAEDIAAFYDSTTKKVSIGNGGKFINHPETIALTADDQNIDLANRGSLIFLTSDNATGTNRTFTLTNCAIGQELTLVFRDADGAAQVADSANTMLDGNLTWDVVNSTGDSISFICVNTGILAETSRTTIVGT